MAAAPATSPRASFRRARNTSQRMNLSITRSYCRASCKALLPVLLSGLQVVPFVEYAGQTKMRFVCKRLRMITCQLQATPKGLGRLIKVIFKFLYCTQADCSH